MGVFENTAILLGFLLEVCVLCFLEVKIWKTLYTPLNFLMLPYVVVLLLSIGISGRWGFIEFYYPSILLWSVGLVLFAVPSFIFGLALAKHDRVRNFSVKEDHIPRLVIYVAFVLVLLFMWRLKAIMGSSGEMIGSDDFGVDYCGHGLWAHLRQFLMVVLIMAIYMVDRKHWWLWLLIVPILVIHFVYQVKGWIIIPVVAGISMRLYTKKTRLNAGLLLKVVLGCALVFVASYIFSLVIADNKELGEDVMAFIGRNFVHYLTSGTLGLSMDMEAGFPDRGDFGKNIIQLVNMSRALTGNGELMDALNPYYYNTGVNLTNVRTMFGSIYINTNPIEYMLYIIMLSALLYSLKMASMAFSNLFIYTAYFFECSMLAMGWFDTYFPLLPAIEIPIMLLVILWGVRLFDGKYYTKYGAKTL